MSDDQPEWAKRMERKMDAILMALQQFAFIGELDSNHIQALIGDRVVARKEVMHWNRQQALKVLDQGLRGDVPELEK